MNEECIHAGLAYKVWEALPWFINVVLDPEKMNLDLNGTAQLYEVIRLMV